ncbi:hypothetical protein [Streptomyces mirabilis]|uniref:hypothetical protein n=1 Tax=Streptomyces mirabilis TaxID=68239 RepID=UPI0036EEE33E
MQDDSGGSGQSDQSGSNQSGTDQSGSDQSGTDQSGNDQSGNSQHSNDQSGNNQHSNDQSGNNQNSNDQSGNNQSSNNQSDNNQTGSQDVPFVCLHATDNPNEKCPAQQTSPKPQKPVPQTKTCAEALNEIGPGPYTTLPKECEAPLGGQH